MYIKIQIFTLNINENYFISWICEICFRNFLQTAFLYQSAFKNKRESSFTFDLSYTILDQLSSSCLYRQQHTTQQGFDSYTSSFWIPAATPVPNPYLPIYASNEFTSLLPVRVITQLP